MSEIKSALEIALARTEGVQSDHEGVRLKGLKDNGKKIASLFLNDHHDENKLKKAIDAVDKADRQEVIKGIFEVFKTNLALPQIEEFSESLANLKTGFLVISGEKKRLDVLFEQLEQFFTQYTQAKEQLFEGLKNQLEPLARQKSQQISQQRGMNIELQPEDLPEFNQALNDHLGQLNNQFQEALDNVREELNSLLAI